MRTHKSYNEIYEMAGNMDFTINLGEQIEAYRSQLQSLLVRKEQEEARLAEEAAEQARQEARKAEEAAEQARQEEAAEQATEAAEEARPAEVVQGQGKGKGKDMQQMIAHKDFSNLFDLNVEAGPNLFDSEQPGTSENTTTDYKATELFTPTDCIPEIPLSTVHSIIPDNLLTLSDLDNWYENKTKEKVKKTTIDSFCKKQWKQYTQEWQSFLDTTNKRHINTQREFQRTIASLQATVDQLHSKIWNLECSMSENYYDKRRKWHK